MSFQGTKVKKSSEKKLDVILYLQGRFPHIIDQIVGELVNEEAFLKMANIQWSNIHCGAYFFHGLFFTTSPSLPTNWMTTTTETCTITSKTAYGRLRINLKKDLTNNRSKASSRSPQSKISKMSELPINTLSLL